MTPKEKARELFYNFLAPVDELNKYPMCYDTAKICAIIAVLYIIDEINDNYDTLHSSDRKLFWEEVKKEINKLHLY